jgi:methylase of polypeptide subunit release factors
VTRLASVGAALRYRGMSGRALGAWATPRLSALPYLVPQLPPADGTAGALLELFVAGRAIELPRLAQVDLDALHRAALIDVDGDTARARVAVLPLGGSLLVCDRLDAPPERELVCWPDDSSYHLAQSLPSRTDRWLDIGCGSAFAQLWRPEIAQELVGTDLGARAIRYARLGAELSDLASFTAHEGDLTDGAGDRAFSLVSCNAPIPEAGGDPYRPMWRQTDREFIARMLDRAARVLAPGGMIVVHAAEDALADALAAVRGEKVLVSYTPEGVRGFAVAWWRPDAPDRHVSTRRDLTPTRPHLTFADHEAAIAS